MNTVSKHTPGPWIVNAYGAIESGRGRTLGRLDGASAEEGRANNLLAATAPALLALAEQYASECGECAGTGITVEDEDCVECKFIRDVIADAVRR